MTRTISKKHEKRQDLLAEIDGAQAELKALAAQIAKSVAADPDYVAKRDEAEDLRRVAEGSLAKTETAEADREQKGRPYREDPLFMYLWEAGYDTKNYKANNLHPLSRFPGGAAHRLSQGAIQFRPCSTRFRCG